MQASRIQCFFRGNALTASYPISRHYRHPEEERRFEHLLLGDQQSTFGNSRKVNVNMSRVKKAARERKEKYAVVLAQFVKMVLVLAGTILIEQSDFGNQ
jgi:hypothetical protein